MGKPRKYEIPVSKITNTTVYADFSGLDGEGTILFLNPKCTLVGLNGVPYILYITADFNLNDLIDAIGDDLYKVKQIILKPSFLSGTSENVKFCKVPDWLMAFRNVDLIKFECVQLDELWVWRDLPVQHFVFKNVSFDDQTIFTDAIAQFTLLNEITYDDSLNEEVISNIVSAKPRLKLTYQTE